MSESRKHMDLVQIVLDYAKSVIDTDLHGIIQYDSPDTSRPPRLIDNYVPDVYFCYKDLLIIGEAKTLDDFERVHSKKQFQSYIKECAAFPGHSIIVIAVPWQLIHTAKNHFRRLKLDANISTKIVVINELRSCFEI